MNIEIDDNHLSEMINNEIKKFIQDKIETVINNGHANWFTWNNIAKLTEKAVADRIASIASDKIEEFLSSDEFVDKLSKVIASAFRSNILDEL